MSRTSDDARRAAKVPPVVSCEGKHGFDSYTLAMAVVEARKRGRRGNKHSAYKCLHCGKFHLGHGSKRVYKQRGQLVAVHGGLR